MKAGIKCISPGWRPSLFLVWAILLFRLIAAGQANEQETKSWFLTKVLDNNNGLLQNSINNIYFDTQTGYLWLCTEAGLVRYDGVSTRIFDKRTNPEMSTVRIGCILQSQKEGILVMERSGRLHKINGSVLESYPSESFITPEFLISPSFKGNLRDVKSCAFMMDRLNNQMTGFEKMFDLANKPFPMLWLKNNTWVSYSASALKLFRDTSLLAEWPKPAHDFPALISHENLVYAITKNGTGFRINTDERTCEKITTAGTAFTTGNPVIFYDRLNDQPLLLNGADLYRITISGKEIGATLIAVLPDLPRHINSILIHPSQKTLFVSTELNGLFVYIKSPFRTYLTRNNLKQPVNSLPATDNIYSCLLTGGEHVLTSAGVLFDLRSGEASTWKYKIGATTATMLDNQKNIWYAHGDWLYRVNNNNSPGTFHKDSVHLTNTVGGVVVNYLVSIYQAPGGRIWVSTGQYLGYIENDTLKPLISYGWGPGSFLQLTNLYQSADGRLLGSNEAGIYYVDTASKKINLLPGSDISQLRSYYIDSENHCWISTYGNGIFLYDEHTKKAARLPIDKNGYLLFSHTFAEDGEGNFLVPTNRGLFRINRKHLLDIAGKKNAALFYQYFDIKSGLITNEFNGGCVPAYNRLPNGDLLFPSLDGLVRANIKLMPSPRNYPLFVDKIETADSTYYYNGETIKFSAKERNIVLNISFGQWEQPYSPGLSYRLDNDTTWEYLPDGERKIQLTGLTGGKHTINVRFQAGFSAGNFSYLTIPFSVKKKYYEQSWFWYLSVISLLLVVYLITKFQTRRLNKRNALLEEKVKEKTLELVEKNEELTGTLFDLENSITDLNAAMDHLQQSNIFKSRLIGVIGQDVMVPLRYISKVSAQLKDHHDKLSRETTLESLGEISTSSRQLQFFGESILHWIKLQDNEYIPLAEKCMLHQMVDELVSFHSPLLAEKKNTVINDIPADLQFVQDPVLLRIIFNNLLLYISKFVSNGEIRINAANEKGILTLSLKDNGKGIPADKIQALNNLEPVRSSLGTIMESGWGMGYILITDLVKFSNGRLLAVSNEKDGTCIQLIIPELNNEPPGYTE